MRRPRRVRRDLRHTNPQLRAPSSLQYQCDPPAPNSPSTSSHSRSFLLVPVSLESAPHESLKAFGMPQHRLHDLSLVGCSRAVPSKLEGLDPVRLRAAKMHDGGRGWQELTAQGEGTLGDLADRVTPASVLHKSYSLLRRVDVHGNDQGRP